MSQMPPQPDGQTIEGRFVLTDRGAALKTVESELLPRIQQLEYDQAGCFAVRLALEEALTNAFSHGNKNLPGKAVTLEFRIQPAEILLEIVDEGLGFDPDSVPDPTQEENIEIPSGRGIILMRAYMSEVWYEPPGNRVRMVYRRPA